MPTFVLLSRSEVDEAGRASKKSSSSSESLETIPHNRSRISPVFAFFVFPFPFLKFDISFFLATRILRLLLQNYEPVKKRPIDKTIKN